QAPRRAPVLDAAALYVQGLWAGDRHRRRARAQLRQPDRVHSSGGLRGQPAQPGPSTADEGVPPTDRAVVVHGQPPWSDRSPARGVVRRPRVHAGAEGSPAMKLIRLALSVALAAALLAGLTGCGGSSGMPVSVPK